MPIFVVKPRNPYASLLFRLRFAAAARSGPPRRGLCRHPRPFQRNGRLEQPLAPPCPGFLPGQPRLYVDRHGPGPQPLQRLRIPAVLPQQTGHADAGQRHDLFPLPRLAAPAVGGNEHRREPLRFRRRPLHPLPGGLWFGVRHFRRPCGRRLDRHQLRGRADRPGAAARRDERCATKQGGSGRERPKDWPVSGRATAGNAKASSFRSPDSGVRTASVPTRRASS